ncbi:MAG: ABC transporter permease [Lachnospiraceae bacterium]|nr:ABC transporter permease [Lachnospiraceae bacterium]
MAGKSGRTIQAVPQNSAKKMIFSWEGALVVLFIALNIFNMIISPSYNITNILREMPKYLAEIFMLFGMAYILVLGDIDISVGSIVCLSATLACVASNAGLPMVLVIAVCLLVGTACGFINGIILTRFTELPAMIVTLATQIIFRGIAEILLGSGGSVSLKDTSGFNALAMKIGPVPLVFFLVVIAAVIFTVILAKTTFGRKLYAIGSNSTAAYYAGVKVQKVRLIVFTVTGLLAGLCALFLTSALFGANTTTGQGFEMDVIAMAVFGGIATTGGKGNLVGGIISAFIIVLLRIALGQINLNPQLILVIIGALLIIAVLIPGINNAIQAKRKMKSA